MVGSVASFHATDVIRCFLLLRDRRGRKDVVEQLELGEGIVRTMLDVLKERGLLESSQQGHKLSRKGEELFNKIDRKLSLRQVSFDDFYPEKKKAAAHVSVGRAVNIDYRLRDIAVRHSADGALIFSYTKGLHIPGSLKRYTELEEQFSFKTNDLLIIAFADHYRDAENGALATALHLLPGVLEAFS